MLGAVIGDVVGSVYEFHNTRDYNFPMFSSSSNFTDDTVMTMAVADWAMKCKAVGGKAYPHQLLEECMVKIANAYPCPMGGYGGKFRLWLFYPQSLTDYRTGKPAVRRCPYNSWGNGSAMRVSSIGWLFDTLEETEKVAGISASITHNHPEGIKGAQAVAAAIYLARTGSGKAEIKRYIEKRFGYNLNESWEHLHQTYRWDSSCQGTVPQALIAFLESKDMESALRMAVSIGGDSDTLACITGAVAEAYYQEIPSFIADKVLSLLPEEFFGLLKQLADGAYAVCYANYIAGHTPVKTRECTPDRISSLKPGEIFVFGSNLAGHHGGRSRPAGLRTIRCEVGDRRWHDRTMLRHTYHAGRSRNHPSLCKRFYSIRQGTSGIQVLGNPDRLWNSRIQGQRNRPVVCRCTRRAEHHSSQDLL